MYFNISSHKLNNHRTHATRNPLQSPTDFLEPKTSSALKPILIHPHEYSKNINDSSLTTKFHQIELRTNDFNDTHDDCILNSKRSDLCINKTKNINSNTGLLTNDNSNMFYKSEGHNKKGSNIVNYGYTKMNSNNVVNDLYYGEDDSWLMSVIEMKNDNVNVNNRKEKNNKIHKMKMNGECKYIKSLRRNELIEIAQRRKQIVMNINKNKQEKNNNNKKEIHIHNDKVENGVQTSFSYNNENNGSHNIVINNNNNNYDYESSLDKVNQSETFQLCNDNNNKYSISNSNYNCNNVNYTSNPEIFEIEDSKITKIITSNQNNNNNNSFSSCSNDNNNNNNDNVIYANHSDTFSTNNNNNITEFLIEENPSLITKSNQNQIEQIDSINNSFNVYQNDLSEITKIQNETLKMDYNKVKNTSSTSSNDNTLKRINYFEDTLPKYHKEEGETSSYNNDNKVLLSNQIQINESNYKSKPQQFINSRYDSDFTIKSRIDSSNIQSHPPLGVFEHKAPHMLITSNSSRYNNISSNDNINNIITNSVKHSKNNSCSFIKENKPKMPQLISKPKIMYINNSNNNSTKKKKRNHTNYSDIYKSKQSTSNTLNVGSSSNIHRFPHIKQNIKQTTTTTHIDYHSSGEYVNQLMRNSSEQNNSNNNTNFHIIDNTSEDIVRVSNSNNKLRKNNSWCEKTSIINKYNENSNS